MIKCDPCDLVTPRLKKNSLPHEELRGCCPMSNLSYVTKLVEREAAAQIKEYLTANDLLARTQSMYETYHSVETDPLNVQSDLLLAQDGHK